MEFEELCKAFREEEVKTKHAKKKGPEEGRGEENPRSQEGRAGHEGTSSRADIE